MGIFSVHDVENGAASDIRLLLSYSVRTLLMGEGEVIRDFDFGNQHSPFLLHPHTSMPPGPPGPARTCLLSRMLADLSISYHYEAYTTEPMPRLHRSLPIASC